MSFLVDYFGHKAKKLYEDPEARREQFVGTLRADAEEIKTEREFSRFDNTPLQLPFVKLKFHPKYEMNAKMFPHKAYTRRNAEQ